MLTAVALTLILALSQAGTAPPKPPANHGASPTVSPDGQWIAFGSDRDGTSQIYVIRPDGTGERRVTSSAIRKSGSHWSADGRSLMFSVVANGAEHFYRVELDGSGEREVLSVPGRDAHLSPDGRHIVYGGGDSWTVTKLMLADVNDGVVSNARQINDGASIAWNVSWSPKGDRLAYTSRATADGQLQVWTMGVDGAGSAALTKVEPSDGGAQVPAWSPDGRTIACQVNGANHSAHLLLIDVATLRATPLLAHQDVYLDETPKWFPDGKRVVFQSDRTGRMEVWSVNADGTGLRQITK